MKIFIQVLLTFNIISSIVARRSLVRVGHHNTDFGTVNHFTMVCHNYWAYPFKFYAEMKNPEDFQPKAPSFFNNSSAYLGHPTWRYKFIRMLDKGSANTQVFVVEDHLSGKTYALKILIKKTKLRSEYKVDMMKMEIGSMQDMASALLDYPNTENSICKLVEVFENDEILMILMDYCGGENF